MDNQPQSELTSQTINPDLEQKGTILETPQGQKLQLEVEKLQREVQKLRLFFQTLVSGLLIATFLAVSISSWFAYRLFIQEQATQRAIEKAGERFATAEENFNKLQANFDSFSEELPEDLAKQNKNLLEYQGDLQQLRDRLSRLEDQQRNLEKSASKGKESN